MTRHTCLRCDWRGEDAEQLLEHAVEAEHPLCICCFRSLAPLERQTCPRCLARVRQELSEVVELYAMLPAMLGHPKSPRLDSAVGDGGETPLPGGDALVMLVNGSRGLSQIRGVRVLGGELSVEHEADEWPDDPQSAAFELSRWEDDWRLVRRESAAGVEATVTGAASYLSGERLRWAAEFHPAFDEFAADVFRLASRLRTTTATALWPARGVPCLTCGTELEREFKDRRQGHGCLGHWDRCDWPYRRHGCTDSGGRVDDWTCPKCGRVYTEKEYGLAVAQRHALARAGAVTAAVIEDTLGIRQGRLRQWANRGKVTRRGKDDRGRTLYDVDEVREHAETAGVLAMSAHAV